MLKVTVVMLGIIFGCALQSSGMELAVKDPVNIQTDPHVSKSNGWFSCLWSCFRDEEEETVSLIASEDKLSKKTPNPYISYKHIPLIEFALKNQEACEVLIDRLYKKLIPDNLIQRINFEDLLELSNDPQSSTIPDTTQMIIITYLSPEDWPPHLGSIIIKRADEGDPKALCLVGYMYLNGKSLPQDLEKAFKAFKKSADDGNGNAQNYVGFLYSKGMGVDTDPYWAGYYYKKSANQGNPSAQNNLGSLYERGEGVGQDYTLAHRYYRLSADQGNVNAQLNLAHLYESGKILDRDVKDAMACYQSYADEGNARAQVLLGLAYIRDEGVERNLDQGIKYLKLAAAQGNERAQLELADLFQNAPDGDEDIDKAIKYLKSSAYLGHTVKSDLAIAYLVASADQGIARAQFNLGRAYDHGWGVDFNRCEVLRYYTLAALQGHTDALNKLSKLDICEGMKVRMELAHNSNLVHRDFFEKMVLKSPVISLNEQQEARKKIEEFISELIDMDKIYVGIHARSEGDIVEFASTSDSYKGLFEVTGNPQLNNVSMGVSKYLERMINATRLLHKAGTCITCLDDRIEPYKLSFDYNDYLSYKISFNYSDYLCFTEFKMGAIDTEFLQKTLMEIIGFFKDSHNIILRVKEPKYLLDKVDDLKISNLNLWSFLNCYTQHFQRAETVEEQEKFIRELGQFFEENFKMTELHLTYAKKFETEFARLVENMTPYRNDLFLKYVGLRDEA